VLVVDVVLLLLASLLPSCIPGSVGVEGVVLELLVDGVTSNSTLDAAKSFVVAATFGRAGARLRSVMVSSRDQELRTVSSQRYRVANAI